MGYRKIMKFVIGMICLFVIINGGYLLVSERKKKDINLEFVNSVGNHGVHVQDNYLLYTNGNGIWSVPFIFDSRLYLYDVEQNKSYLIKNQKGILQEWGTEMCFSENYVLAQGGRGMGDPPADVKYLNLQGESQDIPIETTCMALMKNGIYYVERYFEKKRIVFVM